MVLTPRRWRSSLAEVIPQMTVTKSPITREITKETVKTIARGMPGVLV
jgi:hypothetical protein